MCVTNGVKLITILSTGLGFLFISWFVLLFCGQLPWRLVIRGGSSLQLHLFTYNLYVNCISSEFKASPPAHTTDSHIPPTTIWDKISWGESLVHIDLSIYVFSFQSLVFSVEVWLTCKARFCSPFQCYCFF